MNGADLVQRAAATVGVVGLVTTAPFFLASGLVAPLWAIGVLWLVWLCLALLAWRWFRGRPWLVLLLPVLALAIWWGTLTLGEQVLGWTA